MSKATAKPKWHIAAGLAVVVLVVVVVELFSVSVTEIAVHSWLRFKEGKEYEKCHQYVSDSFRSAPTSLYTGYTFVNHEKGEYIFPFVIAKKKYACDELWGSMNHTQVQINGDSIYYNEKGVTINGYNRKMFYCGSNGDWSWVFSEVEIDRIKPYLRVLDNLYAASNCRYEIENKSIDSATFFPK